MKIRFLYTFFALLTFGCTAEKTGQTDNPTQTGDTQDLTGCYISVTAADSVTLRLVDTQGAITGELVYAYHEKDNNTGTIMGRMRGDTLLADYTFMSEGTESVRQVAFLKKETGFVEGYGDAEERSGSMVFINPVGLDFKQGITFQKIPCLE